MNDTVPGGLTTKLTLDMRDAIKGRRLNEANVLKSLLARISNAEAVEADIVSATLQSGTTEVSRKTLSSEDVLTLLDAEIDELLQTLKKLNDPSDYKSQLEEKLSILQRYK